MKAFTKGVLFGVGVGLLVAPMTGEEMRRLLNERFTELRNSLPDDANAYVQQITGRVSQTGENLRGYAQQAVSKVKDTGSTLGDLSQQSVQEVKRAGQDIAATTQSTAGAVKANTATPKVTPGSKTNL